MKNMIPLTLCIMVVSCLLPSGIQAARAENDVFSVSMPVLETASNAMEAQRQALERGRRKALRRLLRRILKEEYWGYVRIEGAPLQMAGDRIGAPGDVLSDTVRALFPDGDSRLAPGAGISTAEDAGETFYEPDFFAPPQDLQAPAEELQSEQALKRRIARRIVMLDISADRLAELDDGYEVFDEKRSPLEYQARIVYHFRSEVLIDFLMEHYIPYTDEQSGLSLVIPLLEYKGQLFLWESNNPWARIWRERETQNELVPFLVPTGGVEDRALISAEQALEAGPLVMEQLAARYRTEKVMVLYAKFSRTANGNLIEVANIVGFDKTQRSDFAPGSLASSFHLTAPEGRFLDLASRAVERVIGQNNETWKKTHTVYRMRMQRMQIRVEYASRAQWQRLQDALDASNYVRSVAIDEFSLRSALLSLDYVGRLSLLQEELERKGIGLSTDVQSETLRLRIKEAA